MRLRALIDKLRSPFAKFTYKKVAFYGFAVFLTINTIFFVERAMPSDPGDVMVRRIVGPGRSLTPLIGKHEGGGGGQSINLSPKMERLKNIYLKKYGLLKPLHEQYTSYLERAFTLDFGISYWKYPVPISELIMQRLPWTIALLFPTIPIGFVIGNWIGTKAAFKEGKKGSIYYYLSIVAGNIPMYWVGMILILVFGVQLGLFPLGEAYSQSYLGPQLSFSWFIDALHHWVLPFLSLLGFSFGGWAVGMRSMVIYEMESDYVNLEKQLGFRTEKIRQDVQRNAILPNFTAIPYLFSGLVSGGLMIEIIFGYPGMGMLFFNGIFSQDFPLIEASFVIVVFITLIGNMIIDILYGVIDPRIGTGYVRE